MAVYEFLMDESVEIKLLDYLGNPADARGMLTDLSAPDMVQSMDTDLRIGEGGAVNRPMIFEAMEASFTMKGISSEFFSFVGAAQANKQSLTVQVTGKGSDRYSSLVGDLKLILTGFVMKVPLFSLTAGEKGGLEMTMGVNAVTQQVAATTIYFEPGANRYEINGVNQWA